MTRWTKTASIAAAAFALSTGTALAQDPVTPTPAQEVYDSDSGVLNVVESGTPTPTPAAPESGTAPETETASPTPVSGTEDESTTKTPATSTEATPPATATPTTAQQSVQGGSLPFTGMDVSFVALGGLLLLGLGFAMRRASSNPR